MDKKAVIRAVTRINKGCFVRVYRTFWEAETCKPGRKKISFYIRFPFHFCGNNGRFPPFYWGNQTRQIVMMDILIFSLIC